MYKCKKCNEKFKTTISLAGHYNSKHRSFKNKKETSEKLSKINMEVLVLSVSTEDCGSSGTGSNPVYFPLIKRH